MMIKKTILPTIFISLFLFFGLPNISQAAKLIFKADDKSLNQAGGGRVEILLSCPNESINALGGEIFIAKGQAILSDLYNGNSIISAWVEQPKITTDNSIVFSGIMPGGFSGIYLPAVKDPQPGVVLSFIIRAKVQGEVILAMKNLEAYTGNGDKALISFEPEIFKLNFNQVGELINFSQPTDSLAPTDLELKIIKLPQGPTGWWVAFSAQDNGSGIDHYEIQESLFSEPSKDGWRSAVNPTKLNDQSRRSYVFLKAVDRVGNEAIISIPPQPTLQNNIYYLLFSLILLLSLVAYLLNYYGKKKHV